MLIICFSSTCNLTDITTSSFSLFFHYLILTIYYDITLLYMMYYNVILYYIKQFIVHCCYLSLCYIISALIFYSIYITVLTARISELLRRCTYTGCDWQGDSEAYALHAKSCPCRPKGLILQELEEVRTRSALCYCESILRCTMLCCAVLRCAVLCCAVLCHTILLSKCSMPCHSETMLCCVCTTINYAVV